MTSPLAHYIPPNSKPSLLGGLVGSFEVALVIGASTVAAIAAQSMFTPSMGEALGLTGEEPDLMGGAWTLLRIFTVQYGVLFGLGGILGCLRGRRSIRSYALGKGQLSVKGIIIWGVVLGLTAGIPTHTLFFLQSVSPIGADTPIWAALRDHPRALDYWVFLATGSFLIIPLIEELGWRSYALGRLTEAMAPGAAVVFVMTPFALLHVQYLVPDPAMIWAMVSVLAASALFTLATLRTGTVWPAILAHVTINFPFEAWTHLAVACFGLIAIVILRKPILREAGHWAGLLFRPSTCLALIPVALLVGLVYVALQLPSLTIWMAGAAALIVIVMTVLSPSAWKGDDNPEM